MNPAICFVTAAPITVDAFLAPYVAACAGLLDVHLVCSRPGRLEGGTWEVVPIERAIAPASDLRSGRDLHRLFRRLRPAVVHSITPKAGLLAMTAARLARVPNRVHTFTGQVWANRTGPGREVLKAADRAIAASATEVLVDGWSQRSFLVAEGVLRPGQGSVLGFGSVAGSPAPDPAAVAASRAAARDERGWSDGDVVVVFIGRLNVDKGLLDLAEAFVTAHRACPQLRLLIAGPDEEDIVGRLRTVLAPAGAAASVVGDFVPEPQRVLAGADVFCMPSYREGFGSAVIEAAACGVPAVVTDIYGLADTVVDGETGAVVAARDPDGLAAALVAMAADGDRRRTMGTAARARTANLFDPSLHERAARRLYASLLGASDR